MPRCIVRTSTGASSAAATGAAAGAAEGIAISWMLSFVCKRTFVSRQVPHGATARGQTLSNVTRSAACNRVRPEMSSTILTSFGSDGSGEFEVEASAAAVAIHRDEPARELEWSGLCEPTAFNSSVCRVPRTGLRGVPGALRAKQMNTDSVYAMNSELNANDNEEIGADRHGCLNVNGRGNWRRTV